MTLVIHGYLVCTWYDSSSVLLRSINKTCTTPQPICVPYLVPGSLYTLILIIRTHSSLEGAAAAAAAAAAAEGAAAGAEGAAAGAAGGAEVGGGGRRGRGRKGKKLGGPKLPAIWGGGKKGTWPWM